MGFVFPLLIFFSCFRKQVSIFAALSKDGKSLRVWGKGERDSRCFSWDTKVKEWRRWPAQTGTEKKVKSSPPVGPSHFKSKNQEETVLYPGNRSCQVSLRPAAFLGPALPTTKPGAGARLSSGHLLLHQEGPG